ncbi:hypothetical protein [Glutamicibacter mysorens]|uniref:hypothetical protein n=1 Tax=Glutamicibacter mysorens TaxID=257984 RepID=UPI0020C64F6A|nr:hypothetical protein [Glutamicibacter mysorens]UTM47245.1 hypothetical protein XH9_17240 [Glutamicibacter mysorens]
MILADKFSCDMPDFGSTILNCELPGAGAIEWIGGIGTLAAVGVSVFAAIYAITRDRRTYRESVLEVESDAVLRALDRIVLSDADQTLFAIDELGKAKTSFHIRAGSLGSSEARFASSLGALLDAYSERIYEILYRYDVGEASEPPTMSQIGGGTVLLKMRVDNMVRHSLLSIRVAKRGAERESEMTNFNQSVSKILDSIKK